MKNLMMAASAAFMIVGPGVGVAQDQEHQGHPGGSHPAPPAAAPARPTASQGRPAPQPGGAPTYHQPNFGAGNYRPQVNGQPNAGPPDGGRATYNAPNGAVPFNRQAPRPQFNGQQGGQPNVGGPRFPGGQGGYRPQPGQPGFQGGGDGGFRGGYHGQAGPPAGWRGPSPGAQAFNYSGRQFYRYRAAPYAFPRGYYGWAGHSWRRGEWLPSVFIADTYFINDWYDFGLYDPAYGYEWIRVGADAVLVDLATGQVVDAVPGVYY